MQILWGKQNIAVVDDECHVLLECHYYNYIHIFYIEKYIYEVNLFNFVNIMNSSEKVCILGVTTLFLMCSEAETKCCSL